MAKPPTQQASPSRRPPRKRAADQPAQQTKKQLAQGRRAARQSRIIWLSVAGLVVVILAVAIAAIVSEGIVKPGRAVAYVNGAKVRNADYQALLRLRTYNLETNIADLEERSQGLDSTDETESIYLQLYQQQISQLQSQRQTIDQGTLDELIEDALIAEKAREARLSAPGAEVRQRLEELKDQVFAPQQTPVTDTQTVATPTPFPQSEIDRRYEFYLDAAGVSLREHREILRRELIREKVEDLLISEVVTTGLVFHLEVIQADTEEKASQAQQRLEAGEDWSVVAKELSTDSQVQDNGGDLGRLTPYQVNSRFGAEVESAASSLAVGEVGRVQVGEKHYVLRVVERDENGVLPEDEITRLQNRALADWLKARLAAFDVRIERLLPEAALPTLQPTALPAAQPTEQPTPPAATPAL